MVTVTSAQILSLNPKLSNAAQIAQAINDAAGPSGISQSQRRMRYFVAQTLFETQNYTSWSENLYYSSAARLVQVWPSRFTLDASSTCGKACASDYVCSPQNLGALVYANRNGNGDVTSGDGYTYRGRGAIQLTGLSNYSAYSAAQYQDNRVVLNPDLVSQPEDAFASAAWFWTQNSLNRLADSDSFTQATKVINGSTDTVPDRLQVLNKVNSVLQWAA